MSDPKTLSRRQLFARAAAWTAGTVAVPCFIPAGALAAPGKPGPNDRIGIGYIGVGRRGNQLMGLPPEGRIMAVADVDRRRAETTAAVGSRSSLRSPSAGSPRAES